MWAGVKEISWKFVLRDGGEDGDVQLLWCVCKADPKYNSQV